mmetsp:Transcript_14005/g.55217  ORF Transcript_14005/g.55217 Transcript_14005/m.55217 type:complete len:342 (+) Transcript_14005:219-1244(+)
MNSDKDDGAMFVRACWGGRHEEALGMVSALSRSQLMEHDALSVAIVCTDDPKLMAAIVERHPSMVRFVAYGGKEALYHAVSKGKMAQLRELLKVMDWCDVGMRMDASNGGTALHCAAAHGNTEAARLLLEQMDSTAVAGIDDDNRTPLHWAVESNSPEIVDILLQAMPSYTIPVCDNHGNSALCLACRHGYEDIARAIVMATDAHFLLSPPRTTSLSIALNRGMYDNVLLMLERLPCELLHRDSHSHSRDQIDLCLRDSVTDMRIARLLARKLADSPLDYDGNTILHKAAALASPAVVQAVLEELPDDARTWRSNDDRTPLDVAADSQVASILQPRVKRAQ